MNVTIETIFSEALSMPPHERAALAQKLLLSLQTDEGLPDLEEVWRNEVMDRCAAFDEGRMTERDAAEVLRDAYKKSK